MLLASNLDEVEILLIQVTGWQHRRCIIPQAVNSLVRLRMGKIITQNMLS
jgi:hypothetical protein